MTETVHSDPPVDADEYLSFLRNRNATYSAGEIHQTAIIGHPPEVRGWRPGDPCVAPMVHKTARVGAYVTIDAGTVRHTTIGPRTWLLKKVHVGHDAIIGADCELSTGCIIGGHVVIGDGSKVGLGAVVLPHRTVGKNCVIGANATVTKDLPDDSIVAGNPARQIRPNPVRHTERDDRTRKLA
jgi:UDP-N-acetylglucosamine acyltransferase